MGKAPFSMFAPTNDAFSSLNRELTAGIETVTPENITAILRHLVTIGRKLLISQFRKWKVLPIKFTPKTLTINVNGVARITDESPRVSTMNTIDIKAINVVIHAVNKVLLPNFNNQLYKTVNYYRGCLTSCETASFLFLFGTSIGDYESNIQLSEIFLVVRFFLYFNCIINTIFFLNI